MLSSKNLHSIARNHSSLPHTTVLKCSVASINSRMKFHLAAVLAVSGLPVAGAFVARSSSSSTIVRSQLNLHHGDNPVDSYRKNWFGPVAAAVAGLTIASGVALADDGAVATNSPVLALTPVVLQQGRIERGWLF